MDEFKLPSNIDPLGENQTRRFEFQRQITVRVGEIVKGKVLDILGPRQAVLAIPDGTFSAEVSERLQKNDELFFRVQSLEPTLVLKIHGVFAKFGDTSLSTAELIRILDLPSTKIINQIVEFLKSKNLLLLRDDILQFSNQIEKLMQEFPKANTNDFLTFVSFARELAVQPNKTLYNIYENIVQLPKFFELLVLFSIENPEFFSKRFIEKITLFRNFSSFRDVFLFFNPFVSEGEESLFGPLFGQLEQILSPSGKEKIELMNLLGLIKSSFESMEVVNSLALANYVNFLFFIFPIFVSKNYSFRLVKLYQRKDKNNKVIFEFEDSDEKVEPIGSENWDEGYFNRENEWAERYKKYITNLRKRIKRESNSIQITYGGNILRFQSNDIDFDSLRGVSIVI